MSADTRSKEKTRVSVKSVAKCCVGRPATRWTDDLLQQIDAGWAARRLAPLSVVADVRDGQSLKCRKDHQDRTG